LSLYPFEQFAIPQPPRRIGVEFRVAVVFRAGEKDREEVNAA